MINLFIDTNVFLSFYHLTNEDLEELKKLAALIDKNEIVLFLPDQVKKEFTRNRAGKISDAMRNYKMLNSICRFPCLRRITKSMPSCGIL
jgi:predicted nucleic acid-binding protein